MRALLEAPYRAARGQIRSLLFRVFGQIVRHDEGKRLLVHSLQGARSPFQNLPPLEIRPHPYSDIPSARPVEAAAASPIFITARFRTGSTLLWNIFRHLPKVTAYYEPLNERRWFDPSTRGAEVDATHRQVADYWHEYIGLEELAHHYNPAWIDHDLYMDEHTWEPSLKRYIELLIRRANGRSVLQFNRVDFRLPWLRAHFPQARLVHLYRHPREQWCSTLVDIACFAKDDPLSAFGPHDKYYLLGWASDLKYVFPFLDPALARHPYELFYFLWKLSFLFGATYADASIAFEDLSAQPGEVLTSLFESLEVEEYDLPRLLALVEPTPTGKWQRYASDDWFQRLEGECEQVLSDFFCSAALRSATPRNSSSLRPT